MRELQWGRGGAEPRCLAGVCGCGWVMGPGISRKRRQEAQCAGAAPRAGAGDAAERLDHAAHGRGLSGVGGADAS